MSGLQRRPLVHVASADMIDSRPTLLLWTFTSRFLGPVFEIRAQVRMCPPRRTTTRALQEISISLQVHVGWSKWRRHGRNKVEPTAMRHFMLKMCCLLV